MNSWQRLGLALTILVVDSIAFAVPLMAFFAAWVVVRRPAWFLGAVLRLYEDTPGSRA